MTLDFLQFSAKIGAFVEKPLFIITNSLKKVARGWDAYPGSFSRLSHGGSQAMLLLIFAPNCHLSDSFTQNCPC
jgi:hypothetical protein